MDDILNKLLKMDKKNKKEITLNQIELEIQLKIENEKTKQLELLKDIKKIEKSIKQKELYNKRTYFTCRKCIKNSKVYSSDTESDTETETETEILSIISTDDETNMSTSELKKYMLNDDITDDDNEDEDTDTDNNSKNSDSLSMCSSDTEDEIYHSLEYEEIDIICINTNNNL
jgi:hypothetical protein